MQAETAAASEPAAVPEPSLAEVYREHYRFVWRSLRRLGVPEDAVDDAVHDTFLVVHRRLQEFEFRASIRTWLFRIALRVAANARRRRHTRTRRLVTHEAPEHGADDPAIAAHEAQALLDRLLSDVDPDQRAVFVLSELEGHSGPEIAEILQVKLNTVYSRLRLAKAKVQRAYEGVEPNDAAEVAPQKVLS